MQTTLGTGHQPRTTTTRTTVISLFRSSHTTKEHVTIEDVFDAYYDCRKHKRNTESSVRYEMDYEMANYGLWKELNDMTYKPGTSVAFCVTIPKLREVFAADFKDRVVHHLLIGKINDEIENRMTDCAIACRKGKGTLYGARRLREMMKEGGWYVKCDISGFFMSIDKDVLYRIVEDVVRKAIKEDVDWWLWLAKEIVYHRPEKDCELHGDKTLWKRLPDNKTLFRTNGRGLPIGNLTSQVFANLYLAAFDSWVVDRLGSEMRYIRYADDFVMIHPDKDYLLKILSGSRKWLKENRGLSLHERKVVIQKVERGVRFTGYFVKNGIIHPGKRARHNALLLATEWGEKETHTKEERRRMMCRYNSYMGLLSHCSSYKIRRKTWRLLGDYSGIVNINMKKIAV